MVRTCARSLAMTGTQRAQYAQVLVSRCKFFTKSKKAMAPGNFGETGLSLLLFPEHVVRHIQPPLQHLSSHLNPLFL